jgi:hypothetical protein
MHDGPASSNPRQHAFEAARTLPRMAFATSVGPAVDTSAISVPGTAQEGPSVLGMTVFQAELRETNMKPPRSAFSRLPTLVFMTLLAADLVGCSSHGGGGTQSLAITASSPPSGTAGVAYAGYTFAASGGTPPLSWTESGSLPPGLAFNASGRLSGNPTTAGTYAFSVRVSDSSVPPLTANTSVGLKINDSAIVIAPATPPTGTATYPYPGFTFTASGGSPPYTWQSSGTVPPGLRVGSDGTVSGTPTQAGSFSFSVTASDNAQTPMSSAPLSAQITIGAALVINNQEAPTGTVGAAYPPYQYTANNGVPPFVWSETPALTNGLTLGAQGVLSGTPTAAGQFPITLKVTDAMGGFGSLQTVVRVSAGVVASFTSTGSMKIARSGHAATLLLSGKVLVTGGGNGTADPTAELYDPATGTFSSTARNMTKARSRHTATLLNLGNPSAPNDGKVLIVGSGDTSAELYDPITSTFVATGSLNHARTSPTATLLNTGKVLIVGGSTSANDATAELYDPASGTFSFTGNTTAVRSGHTATLLLDQSVLIAGGSGTATAELYDPTHGTFTPTGDMREPRSGHTATLLGTAANAVQSGYVLIIGTDGSADLYDPSSRTFAGVGGVSTATGVGKTASLRGDGTVLAAGGITFYRCSAFSGGYVSIYAAALFAPESDGFTATGFLKTPRDTHTATVLQDGTVLVVGGTHRYLTGYCPQHNAVVLSSAELFR